MSQDLRGHVALSLPPSWMFRFPPDPLPPAVPPAADPGSWRSPFGIDPDLYHAVLKPAVPITFAIGYVTCVKIANSFNRKRGNKPWSISKTRAFYGFVLLHNIGLAVYSAITCFAMWRNISTSVPSPFGEEGLPATLDGLCQVHGPRGLGDAVYYDRSLNVWMSKNRLVHLAANGLTPDPTDAGRIWNEGLAFWGWFFYLSKFYEVLDTIIILAKGKRSSTLQTYHHAGAMMCMWAGMRYAGQPIWMFCLINSGIHTIMYTYYTLSALSIRVPMAIKQLITTAQITQFLVGITFAGAHFFVSYAVPVSVPVAVVSAVASAATEAASSASPAAAAALSNLANTASASSLAAAATGGTIGWLKKLALQAANFEGPAQNVLNSEGPNIAAKIGESAEKLHQVTFQTQYQMVHCLNTEGEGFAIWLNVVYLAPLTFLFARFFVKSYILAQPVKTAKQRRLSDSAMSAARKTSDAIERFGRSIEDTIGSIGQESKRIPALSANEAKRKVKIMVEQAAGSRDVGEAIEDEEDEKVSGVVPTVAASNGSVAPSPTDHSNPLTKPEK